MRWHCGGWLLLWLVYWWADHFMQQKSKKFKRKAFSQLSEPILINEFHDLLDWQDFQFTFIMFQLIPVLSIDWQDAIRISGWMKLAPNKILNRLVICPSKECWVETWMIGKPHWTTKCKNLTKMQWNSWRIAVNLLWSQLIYSSSSSFIRRWEVRKYFIFVCSPF